MSTNDETHTIQNNFTITNIRNSKISTKYILIPRHIVLELPDIEIMPRQNATSNHFTATSAPLHVW